MIKPALQTGSVIGIVAGELWWPHGVRAGDNPFSAPEWFGYGTEIPVLREAGGMSMCVQMHRGDSPVRACRQMYNSVRANPCAASACVSRHICHRSEQIGEPAARSITPRLG